MTTVDAPGIDPPEPARRDFIHVVAGAMALGGAAACLWPLIDSMNPAADTLALASVEVDYTRQRVQVNGFALE